MCHYPKQQSKETPKKDNAAVLEWQSMAAAATDELKSLQQRAKVDADARRELEEELRGMQNSQRNERTSRRAAEEDLQKEIDALREKVRGKEEDWNERLAKESAARQSAEGELRARLFVHAHVHTFDRSFVSFA